MKNVQRLIRAFPALVVLACLLMQGCASSSRISESKEGVPAAPLAPDRQPTVLVCPIDTVSPDQELAHIADALSPLIRRDLFCVQQLGVIPTEDTDVPAKSFFLNTSGLERLARIHGADMVTIALLRSEDTKLSIDFRVYDVKRGFFLLSNKFEDRKARILKMQREIVYTFVEALGFELSKEEGERIESCTPKKLSAILLFGRGLEEERSGRYTEAMVSFGDAADDDKRIAVPYAAEARVFEAYGAPLRSVTSFEMALARDQYYAEAWYGLNMFLSKYKQDNDAAIKCCINAIAIAPRFGKAHLSLGVRLYNRGEIEGAIAATRKAVELMPGDPLARYNMGFYYIEAGKPDEARPWLEQAIGIDPGFKPAQEELQRLPKN